MNSLYITDNKIKSLEPIAGLKKLWTLQVAGNPVDKVAAISELKGLKTLNMQNCGLKKLDFIQELKELSLLMLEQNPLESLEPLAVSCEADSGRRFAPFLRLYLDPKIAGDQAATIERLRKVGVRVNPEKK
jgi:Leucine-rich repeat (LRR) protein